MSYEFYWRDEIGEIHLIGILPERRKSKNRINNESIMNWVKKVIGNNNNNDEVRNIFFTQVNIDWHPRILSPKSLNWSQYRLLPDVPLTKIQQQDKYYLTMSSMKSGKKVKNWKYHKSSSSHFLPPFHFWWTRKKSQSVTLNLFQGLVNNWFC